MNALIETSIISLCVSVPIFVIRHLKLVSSSTSRKLLHISMAPIFMACWHLFPSDSNSKYVAMIIPLAFTLVFWVIGNGFINVSFITNSMSRSGKFSELAMGPVHYGMCISLATLLFWKRVEAFYCILPIAFGDGFAAFFGPHVRGNRRLWWNSDKTWFGLLAFVAFSYIGLCFFLVLFSRNNWLLNDDVSLWSNALIVSILCGLTESLTISHYDNFTVFGMGVLGYAYVHYHVCYNKELFCFNSSYL